MSRLPSLTSKQVLKALLKAGFVQKHQRGSHLTVRHPGTGRYTTVPMHSGDLYRGLVKDIINQAGLTEEQFRELL